VLHAAVALVVSLSASCDPATSKEAAKLDLAKLYVTNGASVRVAPDVEALAGRCVRVVGFMARMEEPPRSALYLTRAPVEAEEGGGGTGDLPPGALRVEVPRFTGQEIEWIPGAIEVTGVLRVGRAEDDAGRVSWLRVVVDDLPGTPVSAR